MHQLAPGRHHSDRPTPRFPDLPYVDLPRPQITSSHPNGYLWERDHIDTWLGDAPAIWIDDDFTNVDHEWAAERTSRGQATALVQPDPHVGLLAEHLVETLAWAAALPSLGRVSGTFRPKPRNRGSVA